MHGSFETTLTRNALIAFRWIDRAYSINPAHFNASKISFIEIVKDKTMFEYKVKGQFNYLSFNSDNYLIVQSGNNM